MDFYRLWTILAILSPGIAVGIRRYSTDLLENDVCGFDTSVYFGKCKTIRQCANLLAEKKSIEVCSFNGAAADETLVCCSREDFYKSRSVMGGGVLDYESCLGKYKGLRNVNDESVRYIVNGVEVGDGEFPHIAALGWIQWANFAVDWHCGGVLVTETFVLTAAHCVRFNGRAPNVVRLGDVDLKSSLDDASVQQFAILNTVRHPSYRTTSNDHDVALIQINGRVFPTRKVVPACVLADQPPTDYFEAAGYGQDGTGLQTNKLSKVQLKQIPMEKCQKSYAIELSADSQLCAQGYRDDVDTQDTCYGDSGAPLQYMNANYTADDGRTYHVPTVVGLTSFGIGCGFNLPSVYVKVSNYIGWMESVIMP